MISFLISRDILNKELPTKRCALMTFMIFSSTAFYDILLCLLVRERRGGGGGVETLVLDLMLFSAYPQTYMYKGPDRMDRMRRYSNRPNVNTPQGRNFVTTTS